MAPELVKRIVGILGYASEIELKHLSGTAEGRGCEGKRGEVRAETLYTPQQAATVMEMRDRGDGYGTIASALGMTKGMVRRITLNHSKRWQREGQHREDQFHHFITSKVNHLPQQEGQQCNVQKTIGNATVSDRRRFAA